MDVGVARVVWHNVFFGWSQVSLLLLDVLFWHDVLMGGCVVAFVLVVRECVCHCIFDVF